MSRRCGSSKPNLTPLNSLAMKPGKTRKKVIEGNADTTMSQTTIKNLPRTVSVVGGARGRKANWEKTQALRQGKPTTKRSRRLPSRRRVETTRRKPTRNGKGGTTHSPAREERASLKTHGKKKPKLHASRRKEDKKNTVLATV